VGRQVEGAGGDRGVNRPLIEDQRQNGAAQHQPQKHHGGHGSFGLRAENEQQSDPPERQVSPSHEHSQGQGEEDDGHGQGEGLERRGQPFGDIVAEDSGVAEELAHGETGREQPADDQQSKQHEGADATTLERVRGNEVEGAPGVPGFPLGPRLADHRGRGIWFEVEGGAQTANGVCRSPFARLNF
jgi:hypothetical protein